MEVVLDAVDVADVLVVCGVLVLGDNVVETKLVEVSDVDAIVGVVVSEVVLSDRVVDAPVVVVPIVLDDTEELISCVVVSVDWVDVAV
jgi:hypothetical protein